MLESPLRRLEWRNSSTPSAPSTIMILPPLTYCTNGNTISKSKQPDSKHTLPSSKKEANGCATVYFGLCLVCHLYLKLTDSVRSAPTLPLTSLRGPIVCIGPLNLSSLVLVSYGQGRAVAGQYLKRLFRVSALTIRAGYGGIRPPIDACASAPDRSPKQQVNSGADLRKCRTSMYLPR